MRDRTQAAKDLLAAGWTFDEVAAVLQPDGRPHPGLLPLPMVAPYVPPCTPGINFPSDVWPEIDTTGLPPTLGRHFVTGMTVVGGGQA